MIDVKQAVKLATDFFTDLYGDKDGLQLEEVELTDDGKYWLITLSYQVPNALSLAQMMSRKKEYKIFKINVETGEVQSMKIREVA